MDYRQIIEKTIARVFCKFLNHESSVYYIFTFFFSFLKFIFIIFDIS